MSVPLTLSDDSTLSLDVDFSPAYVAFLMLILFSHDYRAIQKRIFTGLGIDMQTRHQTGNVPNVASERTHEYRKINKALSMELLTGILLTHLNSATQVRSWCLTRDGTPHYFAPSGFADLEAIYDGTGKSKGFRVVVEVSAKREVDAKNFTKQLNQALAHANNLMEDSVDVKVYALVINGGSVMLDPELDKAFREFVDNHPVRRNDPVSVIPVHAGELAVAVRRIDDKLPAGSLRFSSSVLVSIFKSLLKALSLSRSELRREPNRLCDIWLETVKSSL